jgi:hypothetical protein
MIEWLTMADLEASLSGVPPIGLGLRSFFHGRVSANLAAVFDHAPEPAHMDDVGDMLVWAGVVDGTPFSVAGQRRGEVTGFGISLPIAIKDGRIDIGLLDVVEALGSVFHTARPHIESLPFTGGGFGVVPRGSDTPIFRSPVREEVTTVLSFLNDNDRYELAILPVAPVQYIVAGPRLGSTISRLEVVPTRAAADELAAAWSAEHHHHIDVFEGQLPA